MTDAGRAHQGVRVARLNRHVDLEALALSLEKRSAMPRQAREGEWAS